MRERTPWITQSFFVFYLALGTVAVLVNAWTLIADPLSIIAVVYHAGVIGFFVAAIGLFFVKVKAQLLIYVLATSLFLPVFAFNALQWLSSNPFGPDGSERLTELRQLGIVEYPFWSPARFLSYPLRIDGVDVLPLSGVQNSDTMLCGEYGREAYYASDEFGFNNPQRAWSAPVAIVFLGDSYTQGVCVEEYEHFSGILRGEVPGYLNLGVGATGPLIQYAILREYLGGSIEPRYVFWFYAEHNDLLEHSPTDVKADLDVERRSDILRRYLNDDGYRQGLIARQGAVGRALRDRIDWVHTTRTRELQARTLVERLRPHLKSILESQFVLGHISKYRRRNDWKRVLPRAREELLPLYGVILQKARVQVESWGGKLVLVYLPSKTTFLPRWAPVSGRHPLKDDVLALARSNGLDIIDVEERFRREDNPLGRLFFSHYSPQGYAVVAEAVLSYLRQVGAVPDIGPARE